ncbi:MAG TPA: DUF5615 family PIN-like protein [Armatimonadota bacterium]|nr:DUF5615 family PIN-like protein [Armatimonadota bacterium]
MARLIADENFDHRIVRALRLLGHDILTLPEPSLSPAGAADASVIAIATAHGRAVLTHNRRDFVRLHRSTAEHGGIIVVSPDPDPPAVAMRLHLALNQHPDLTGLLLRVNLPQR